MAAHHTGAHPHHTAPACRLTFPVVPFCTIPQPITYAGTVPYLRVDLTAWSLGSPPGVAQALNERLMKGRMERTLKEDLQDDVQVGGAHVKH